MLHLKLWGRVVSTAFVPWRKKKATSLSQSPRAAQSLLAWTQLAGRAKKEGDVRLPKVDTRCSEQFMMQMI